MQRDVSHTFDPPLQVDDSRAGDTGGQIDLSPNLKGPNERSSAIHDAFVKSSSRVVC
jgi:hypothetical protein